MLGIPAQTLRAWEDRYEQVIPTRSASGQRLYSRDQVDQLSFVREQLELGLQPADAHRLLAEQLLERAQGGADQQSIARGSAQGSSTVLLAERDPFAAEFADYFLRTEGYSVSIVLDALVAAQVLKTDPPDLIVIDLMISGGAGMDLCRTAREGGAIPVLAVSALDSRDDAFDSGADAFLQKPIDSLQFVSTVRDLLGTSAYLRRGAARVR